MRHRYFRAVRWCLFLACGLSACAEWRVAGETADDLSRSGADAFRQGQLSTAGELWREGLQRAERERREDDAAAFRLNLARLDEASGRYLDAQTGASTVANYARQRGNRLLLAQALNVLALVQRRLGRHAESLTHAREALAIAESHDVKETAAESLMNIGAAHQARTEFNQAYRAYAQGLRLARTAGGRETEAALANNLGGLHRLRAEYREAERNYNRSLTLRRRLGDVRGMGKVLGNLCILYQNLNDLDKALPPCRDSLAYARTTGDRQLEANTLNNLGGLYRTLAEHQPAHYRLAIESYRGSQRIKAEIGDRAGEARALGNLGDIDRRRGDIPAALDHLHRSTEIAEAIGERTVLGSDHYLLGMAYLDAGRNEEACGEFGQALGLLSTVGQPELLWRGFDGLSRCWSARSRPELAIFFGKQAVNTIQAVRSGLQSMDPGTGLEFLRDKTDVYRRLSSLLIDEGRLLEAQQVLAMLKEEEYFDFRRRGLEQDPRGTPLPSSKLETMQQETYVAAATSLVNLGREYAELKRIAESTPTGKARLTELDAQLREAREKHLTVLREIESTFIQAGGQRAKEFGEKDLKSLKQLGGVLKGLAQPTVLVHYLLTDDRVRIILTLPDPSMPPLHRDSGIPRSAINPLIARLRERLEDPRSDPVADLDALYAALIGPIEADLAAAAPKVLMVSLDQALRYVPFAALHDGKQYLAERYGLAMYTVWAKAVLSTRPAADWHAAALGMSKAARGFPALPAVRAELDAIVREGGADTDGVLPGEVFVDDSFTAAKFSEVLRSGYPLIHLASHFHFQAAGTDEDSFLLLGDGTQLSLHELQIGDYPLSQVELLTFSACETALGGSDADGREIESFGMLAQQQGAPAVMATLWKVADQGTAQFMARFYARREQQHETKAEALRQTQIEFIRGALSGMQADTKEGRGQALEGRLKDGDAGQPPAAYAHPYYWAPFILMGNWL